MIEQLHWSDFEILIDLIFARGGWQRTTRLGETMADVDLLIEQTTLSETASVQIKSRASQGVLDALIEMHRKSGRHRRTFFVCHTAETAMSAGEHGDVHLWTGEFLAEIAVRSRFGLASLIGLWNARGSRPNSRQGLSNLAVRPGPGFGAPPALAPQRRGGRRPCRVVVCWRTKGPARAQVVGLAHASTSMACRGRHRSVGLDREGLGTIGSDGLENLAGARQLGLDLGDHGRAGESDFTAARPVGRGQSLSQRISSASSSHSASFRTSGTTR